MAAEAQIVSSSAKSTASWPLDISAYPGLGFRQHANYHAALRDERLRQQAEESRVPTDGECASKSSARKRSECYLKIARHPPNNAPAVPENCKGASNAANDFNCIFLLFRQNFARLDAPIKAALHGYDYARKAILADPSSLMAHYQRALYAYKFLGDTTSLKQYIKPDDAFKIGVTAYAHAWYVETNDPTFGEPVLGIKTLRKSIEEKTVVFGSVATLKELAKKKLEELKRSQ